MEAYRKQNKTKECDRVFAEMNQTCLEFVPKSRSAWKIIISLHNEFHERGLWAELRQICGNFMVFSQKEKDQKQIGFLKVRISFYYYQEGKHKEAKRTGKEAVAFCHKHEEKCKKIFYDAYWTLAVVYLSLGYRWRRDQPEFNIAVFKGNTGNEGLDLLKIKKAKEASEKALQFKKKYGTYRSGIDSEVKLLLDRAKCFLFLGEEEEMEESFR